MPKKSLEDQRRENLENLHDQWLASSFLNAPAQLRLDILDAITQIQSLEEKTKKNLKNPIKRSGAKKTIAELKQATSILENMERELHNLMIVMQSGDKSKENYRIEKSVFNRRFDVLIFQTQEMARRQSSNKELNKIISDIDSKISDVETKLAGSVKAKKK